MWGSIWKKIKELEHVPQPVTSTNDEYPTFIYDRLLRLFTEMGYMREYERIVCFHSHKDYRMIELRDANNHCRIVTYQLERLYGEINSQFNLSIWDGNEKYTIIVTPTVMDIEPHLTPDSNLDAHDISALISDLEVYMAQIKPAILKQQQDLADYHKLQLQELNDVSKL